MKIYRQNISSTITDKEKKGKINTLCKYVQLRSDLTYSFAIKFEQSNSIFLNRTFLIYKVFSFKVIFYLCLAALFKKGKVKKITGEFLFRGFEPSNDLKKVTM